MMPQHSFGASSRACATSSSRSSWEICIAFERSGAPTVLFDYHSGSRYCADPMAQTLTTPFSADTSSDLPVGVQLAWRLRSLIAAGRLGPGDRMPGVRTMAEWAGVNVNTVRAVYARL